MTIRLYLNSDALTAQTQVLRCDPLEEGYAVELASTPFHPQGGGQPADSGTIGDAQVLNVSNDGERVIHHVSRPVPLGPVTAEVDAARRALHTRLHSAGHVLGYLGEQLGWQPVKANHRPGEAKVTFNAGPDSRQPEAEALQQGYAQLLAERLPRRIVLREDGLREVSFGDKVAYACGGTHVTDTGELPALAALQIKMKKGQLQIGYALAEA
ncbi:alanyl-tRNA editing protein (plasmid) [Chimaeribacter arupi]|uniref:alanyl-tRNA editing protein n=1 Tax=Chimaeribacter arupi TaxID=2060066 RepID=UPI002711FCDE|nr:alanyl-tRNA editing protein [Chimaeribacter arupi]WKZ94486.1 alanyl-tRNA editing protein [Chimaeribacter arupi]